MLPLAALVAIMLPIGAMRVLGIVLAAILVAIAVYRYASRSERVKQILGAGNSRNQLGARRGAHRAR
jgi:hypothetical protein